MAVGLAPTELEDSAEIYVGRLLKIKNGGTSVSLSTLRCLAAELKMRIDSFSAKWTVPGLPERKRPNNWAGNSEAGTYCKEKAPPEAIIRTPRMGFG